MDHIEPFIGDEKGRNSTAIVHRLFVKAGYIMFNSSTVIEGGHLYLTTVFMRADTPEQAALALETKNSEGK